MNLPIMAQVAVWSIFVPALLGLWRYRRLDRPMRLFAAFSMVGVINVVLEFVLGRLGVNNYFLSDLYFLLTVLFLGFFYHISISAPRARRFLAVSSGLYLALWILHKLFFADPNKMSSELAMITAIFLVAMSIVTFSAFLKTSTSTLPQRPLFWVLGGTIVYYSGSFAVMGLSNELLKLGISYFETAWHINWILIVVSMLMYAKGFLCKAQS
ncbi:MAG: hypothetical protein NTU47_11355 [Ignavibacteriales bacterium]|nr:hypothetical protein [Ignavibacteriales bacterium]